MTGSEEEKEAANTTMFCLCVLGALCQDAGLLAWAQKTQQKGLVSHIETVAGDIQVVMLVLLS